MSVQGDIQDVHLENLIHIVHVEKRTAVLKLVRKNEKALIYFLDGQVVHALSTHSKKNGEIIQVRSSNFRIGVEAFYHILGWPSGKFSLQLNVLTKKKTIDMPCEKLLLNTMVEIDTKKQSKKNKIKRKFTPVELAQDRYMENDLVQLISDLEHSLRKLEEQVKKIKPEQMVDLLAGMINKIAVYVDKYKDIIIMDKDPLNNFLTIHGYSCPASRYLKVKGNRIVTDSAIALYKVLKNDSETQQQFLDEIKESLLLVMMSYYEYLLTSFNTVEFFRQWVETSKEFFSQLRRILELNTE